MTAVKGPFLFTSDRWSDDFITKAKQAGCGAIALQLGVAPLDAAGKVRAAGLQVIAWGVATPSFPPPNDSVWMPQAENTSEFEQLIFCLNRGMGSGGIPIEPVMTSGGMEPPGNPTPEEKVAERKRRIGLLNSFGIDKVWVEVYKQDADKSGQPNLGDVNHMCYFFESAYGFEEAHPVIGLWTVDDSEPWAINPYEVVDYDLTKHGRTFGAWRAEQMLDGRYAEMAAVPALWTPPTPKIQTQLTRDAITLTAQIWENSQGGVKPLTRISICKRIAGSEFTQEEWNRLAPTIKALLDLEHQ